MTATTKRGGNREADSQSYKPVQGTGGCIGLSAPSSNCLWSKKVVRFCGRIHGSAVRKDRRVRRQRTTEKIIANRLNYALLINRPVHLWAEQSFLQVSWSSGLCVEHEGVMQPLEVLHPTDAAEIQGRNFLLYSSSAQDGSTDWQPLTGISLNRFCRRKLWFMSLSLVNLRECNFPSEMVTKAIMHSQTARPFQPSKPFWRVQIYSFLEQVDISEFSRPLYCTGLVSVEGQQILII